MGKEKVVYLIPSELIVFDAVFNGAKEVCIAGVCTPQSRVGISNGVEHALLDRLASIGEMDQTGFLREFVQRMIRAGIVHPEGARIDTEVVGVLQILVPRDRISVHEIARRDTKRLTATDFETMQKCFTLWHPGVRLEKFVREVLKVPEPEVHKWACSLVRWGVAENVSGSKSPAAAQWMAVEKEFPMFHFAKGGDVASETTVPAPRPKATVKPKTAPAPKPVELISASTVYGLLAEVRAGLADDSADEKEKARVAHYNVNARVVDEAQRLSESMQKGEILDTSEYNRLVAERKRLAEIMNQPDNTPVIAAYDLVIKDLATRLTPRVKLVVPVIEETEGSVASVPAVKTAEVKLKSGRWRSKTGLSVMQLAIYSVMKTEKVGWLTMIEIHNLLLRFDGTVVRMLVACALYDEARRVDGMFEKREVEAGERATVAKVARGIRFVYRLTEKGQAAARKLLEKSLEEVEPTTQEKPKSVSRPVGKKRIRRRHAKKGGKLCFSERIAKNWAQAPDPLPTEVLPVGDVHALVTANDETFKQGAMSWGLSRRPDLFQKELIPVEPGHKFKHGESHYRYKLTPKALKLFGVK